jgi:hypothetical protein
MAKAAQALTADPRPGAKAILDAIARRRSENRAEGQRLRQLLQISRYQWFQEDRCSGPGQLAVEIKEKAVAW